MRRINEAGLSLIKSFEGCKLKAYRDIVGILTIGYGHTGADVHSGMEISQEEADSILKKDLERFEGAVDGAANESISDNQFAALVAFAFNVGAGAFNSSTLLRKVNAGDYSGAAEEFLRWDKAGGKVVAGLTRRRQAERSLFLS